MIKIDTAKKFFPTAVLDKLLIVGEKNVDFVEFELDRFYNGIDLSTAVFTLLANIQTYSVTQILSKAVSDTTITLKWTIDENFTAIQGEMSLEIKAVTDTEVFKCLSNKSFRIMRGNSVGTAPSPDVYQKMLDDIARAISGCNGKADSFTYVDNVFKLMSGETELARATITSGGGGGGTDGRQVELQKSAAYIQWRYVGDTEWTNLVALADITGAKGEQGQQGPQGILGPKGDTGLTGTKGDTGATGATGSQGIQGIKGDKGDTGLQGLQGIQGEKGDTGAQGQAGTNGTTPVKGTDYFTQADIDSLGIKPLQVTVTSAAPTITLADNTIFTCTTTLTSFTIPTPTGNISCQIDFNSGTTATNNIVVPAAFKLTGANVASNVFTPVANKHYTLSIFTSNSIYYMIVGAF